ncbi:MAG TPA: type II toxin-antitoxin system VapC family toxin [Gemmatimonadaceae bacterium]
MIVLDTHALLWWVSAPDKIPRKSRRLLDKAMAEKKPIAVSSISLWEIAMLVERGRLELTMPLAAWISHLESIPWLSFVAVDNGIAVRSVQLDGFSHRDPADRIIVATALAQNATLITADDRLRTYSPLRSAWD